MKKKALPLLLLFIYSGSCFACTTFFINKNGKMVFGRNYDWVTGNGMICTNQRGLSKTSAKTQDGTAISWISRYGSITFNQYGKEFPTGGMNEKGLVVELMWLDGTSYPSPDNRPSVDVLQWIQYQLDNCGSVDELIATDSRLRIASKGNTPLHYLAADAAGNAATIEFLEGKMIIHKGSDLPFPVLTNDTYSSALAQTKNLMGSAGGMNTSSGNNSIDRFAKACTMVNLFQQTPVGVPATDYSFLILDQVAQGSHTKWSIVYDLQNKKISFKTLAFPAVKTVAFSAFDFNCGNLPKVLELNREGGGDMTAFFGNFSLAINKRLVNQSCEESTGEINISDAERQRTWQYPGTISCFNHAIHGR